jgi:hypothetical protein
MTALDRLLAWIAAADSDDAGDGPFAPRVVVDDWGETEPGEPPRRPKDATVVIAHGDDRRGTVVMEYEDHVCGLWYRAAWVYSAGTEGIDHLVRTRGTIPPPGKKHWGGDRDVSYLASAFGYRPYTPADASAGMSLQEAELLVETHLGRPLTDPYDRNRVLVNDATYYLPFGWIGCCGHIVERATKRVETLGSGDVEDYLWAWHRGVLHETPSRHDLEIVSVRDMDQLRRVLRVVTATTWFAAEVAPKLERLPCRFESVDLYPAIPDLRRAEMSRGFEFRIHPATGPG